MPKDYKFIICGQPALFRLFVQLFGLLFTKNNSLLFLEKSWLNYSIFEPLLPILLCILNLHSFVIRYELVLFLAMVYVPKDLKWIITYVPTECQKPYCTRCHPFMYCTMALRITRLPCQENPYLNPHTILKSFESPHFAWIWGRDEDSDQSHQNAPSKCFKRDYKARSVMRKRGWGHQGAFEAYLAL